MSENKDEVTIDIGEFVEYRVPLFKTARGVWILIFEALILVSSIADLCSKNGNFLAFCIATPLTGLFPFLFWAKNMTYVRLSKDCLIVKRKFYCFTKEIVYENSNILEVQFEFIKWERAERAGNNRLTIITKDADINSYKLDTFKRRTFFDLKNAMVGYGINVTDKMDLTEKEFKTFMHK